MSQQFVTWCPLKGGTYLKKPAAFSLSIFDFLWTPGVKGLRVNNQNTKATSQFFFRQRVKPRSALTQVNGRNPKVTAETKYSGRNPFFTILNEKHKNM